MFLDENKNIVQSNMDGGDTAQRTGFLETALKIREGLGISNEDFLKSTPWRFENAWPTLIVNHKLIRNPRPGTSKPPWNDPKDCSRDQTTCMIFAFGLNKMPELVKAISPKGFPIKFYPNWDPASPENLGMVDRALGCKPSWLADHWAGFGIESRIHQAKKNQDDVGDDLNCLASAVFSVFVLPTSVSKENLKFYLENRPTNFGVTKLGEKDPVIGALKWYFRPETGGNPELAEIWRPIVEHYRATL